MSVVEPIHSDHGRVDDRSLAMHRLIADKLRVDPTLLIATGLCIDVHDLALSKYAAGREQDIAFNRELARAGILNKRTPKKLLLSMPIDADHKRRVLNYIRRDFATNQVSHKQKAPG